MASCNKCGSKSNCGCANGGGTNGGAGSSSSVGQLSAQVSALTDQLNTITTAIAPFVSGHPILMLQNLSDITSFNTSTGLGFNIWTGWALCNGNTYQNTLVTPNTTLISPNLVDKFVVGAGGTYVVGNTGGAATVSLTAAQNGTHTHLLTDPGHTHIVTDLGHNHNVVDPGHNHAGNTIPQNGITGTTQGAGDHTHTALHVVLGQTGGGGSTNNVPTLDVAGTPYSTVFLSNSGNHVHTFTTDAFVVTTSVQTAFTGVNILNAFTGITNQTATTGITIQNSGTGAPHENLPPFYSVLFVIKL